MHKMCLKLSVSYSFPTCLDVYTSSPASLFLYMLQINKMESYTSSCYQELLD